MIDCDGGGHYYVHSRVINKSNDENIDNKNIDNTKRIMKCPLASYQGKRSANEITYFHVGDISFEWLDITYLPREASFLVLAACKLNH